MKKVKVLYISYDSALEPIPQSQVIPYLKELSKKGYVFHWLSFEKMSHPDLKEKRDRLAQDLRKYNIIWHPLTYYKRPYLIAKIFNIFCGVIVSSIYILRNKISIIHCRSEVASVIGLTVKFIFRKKMIYDRRGFMAEDYVEGGMWKTRKSFLYKLLIFVDNKLLLYSDRIVILAHKMKDWLAINRPWVRDKITVIRCCVDVSRFDSNNNSKMKAELGLQDKFLFVYSGSLGTWYLLDNMIDFFKSTKKYIPNAHFLILTMSDHRIAKDIIKKKNVKVDDFTIKTILFDEVPKFLQCADSSICFIKPVISKLASSPTKLAEFLASGIPVVINSGIGDCDEILQSEKIGVVVKDFTNEEYRQSVDRLLLLINEKESLRKRCIESARKYFSLSDGVAKYKEIYQALSQEEGQGRALNDKREATR